MPINQNQIRSLTIASVAAAATAGRPNEIAHITALTGIFKYVVDPLLIDNATTIVAAQGANAHWVMIANSAAALVNNLIAVTNPTTTSDSAAGYAPGSLWYNTKTYDLFVAKTTALGAAVWVSVSNDLLNNYAAIIAPTATDDSALGYSVGSTWVDSITGDVYVCTSSAVAAATWSNISGADNPLASAHEVIVLAATLLAGAAQTVVTPLGANIAAFNGSKVEVLLNGVEQQKAVDATYGTATTLSFSIDLFAGDVITIKP